MQTKLNRQQLHQSYLRKPTPRKDRDLSNTIESPTPSVSDTKVFSSLSQESKGM